MWCESNQTENSDTFSFIRLYPSSTNKSEASSASVLRCCNKAIKWVPYTNHFSVTGASTLLFHLYLKMQEYLAKW